MEARIVLDALIIGWVVIAAILVICCGVWVGLELIRELRQPGKGGFAWPCEAFPLAHLGNLPLPP
jgi:hypothetical protein